MKKHPVLAAGAAAGTAVLGAAYAVYRVAFYQKPTTEVPSPADMPTRECYRKAIYCRIPGFLCGFLPRGWCGGSQRRW